MYHMYVLETYHSNPEKDAAQGSKTRAKFQALLVPAELLSSGYCSTIAFLDEQC